MLCRVVPAAMISKHPWLFSFTFVGPSVMFCIPDLSSHFLSFNDGPCLGLLDLLPNILGFIGKERKNCVQILVGCMHFLPLFLFFFKASWSCLCIFLYCFLLDTVLSCPACPTLGGISSGPQSSSPSVCCTHGSLRLIDGCWL